MALTLVHKNRRRLITPVAWYWIASALCAVVAFLAATLPVETHGHDLDWAAVVAAAIGSVVCATFALLTARATRVYDRRRRTR